MDKDGYDTSEESVPSIVIVTACLSVRDACMRTDSHSSTVLPPPPKAESMYKYKYKVKVKSLCCCPIPSEFQALSNGALDSDSCKSSPIS
jgi:hypothetical protein